jgi:hypothetical protein
MTNLGRKHLSWFTNDLAKLLDPDNADGKAKIKRISVHGPNPGCNASKNLDMGAYYVNDMIDDFLPEGTCI